MSKIKSSWIEILISKERADSLESAPTDLVSLECKATSFGWDFGAAEEDDTTPLCEEESRHTEYSLKGKGTISLEMFFEPDSEAYNSIEASNTDLQKRYIKVIYKDVDKKVVLTREVLGTVESISEATEVGTYIRATISIGTSGRVKKTKGEVTGD